MSSQKPTIDALLQTSGFTLDGFLLDQREAGLSYFRIARQLERLTGGVVVVTGETIRNWLRDIT